MRNMRGCMANEEVKKMCLYNNAVVFGAGNFREL